MQCISTTCIRILERGYTAGHLYMNWKVMKTGFEWWTQHLVYIWYVMICADNDYGAQRFIGYYTIIPWNIVWYVTNCF